MDKPVYVYGTLREPSVFRMVTGMEPKYHPARIKGYRKDGLNIVETGDDQELTGDMIYASLETLERLDMYESVQTGLYKRITVKAETSEGTMDCIAYQLV